VLHNYLNTNYFVEPIFCSGPCSSQPYITVTAPNSAATVPLGLPYTITYATNLPGVSTVQITLSTNGGLSYATVIAPSAPCSGSFVWTPNQTCSTCRVQVALTTNSSVFDTSDVNFVVA
jgi:hypothetical protein